MAQIEASFAFLIPLLRPCQLGFIVACADFTPFCATRDPTLPHARKDKRSQMTIRLNIRVLVCAVLMLCAPVAQADPPVTVFAAASLKTALDEIAADWQGDVTLSYAGSGAIARQVAQSAPADLVVLANPQWMVWLQDQGVVDPDNTRMILGNTLVVIAPAGHGPVAADQSGVLLQALDGGRLATGQTTSVPAGIYARAWLETAGLWADLSPHLAEAENVRAALAYVARGEAPLGVVYASDAIAEPAVSVVYTVPSDQHPQILYAAAPLTPDGAAFLDFLTTAKARSVFAANGFVPLDPS